MLDRLQKAHSQQPDFRGDDVAGIGRDATATSWFGEFLLKFWWTISEHVVDQLLREICG